MSIGMGGGAISPFAIAWPSVTPVTYYVYFVNLRIISKHTDCTIPHNTG